MRLVLRPEAEDDLEDIRIQSIMLFGHSQACRYQDEVFEAMEGLTTSIALNRECPEL